MRSNQNLQGSTNRHTADKLGRTGMPVEWLDSGCWRLPSGKALAEFALQAGFLAPLLLKAEQFGSGSTSWRGAPSLTRGAAAGKRFDKGSGQ